MSDFQTPEWCCLLMASMVPPGCSTVLEPTPGEGNLVRALSGKYNVTAPKDFFAHPLVRVDCVVMNPPFSPMSMGYEILDRCMSFSDNVVALMPWLVLINSSRRVGKLLDFGLESVTHLPRCTFPGARVQCCILVLRRGYRGQCTLKFASPGPVHGYNADDAEPTDKGQRRSEDDKDQHTQQRTHELHPQGGDGSVHV